MVSIELFFNKLANALWGNWLLFALLGVGILYSFITGFVQVRYFFYIIKNTVLYPLMKKDKNIEKHGTITSFQALCTALASCVGSGNIIGVSTAILSGGLGAIFWMWIAAFVGMATKFGEIVLGILYREKDKDGNFVGGPMYICSKGLKLPWLGTLAAIFMVIQIIGGNFIQSNTISGVMKNNFNVSPIITGILLIIIIGSVVTGGLKRLANVTQKIVPFMAISYIVLGIIVILINWRNIPSTFEMIFEGAFSIKAGFGGVMGVTMKEAMRFGVARGLYSNEAGEGSASVIHSAANVSHPVQQAINGVTEVFIDTFIICTITGLIIGTSGLVDSGLDARILISSAFGNIYPMLSYLISFLLLLFSLTTLMSQWYFGFVGLNYIFGEKVAKNFKYVFPCFCFIGSVSSINLVWLIQDCALGLLVIPNLIAMVILSPLVRKNTKDYFSSELYIKSKNH